MRIVQAYRSGHNEAVLKTVWVKAHGGSNPSACAISNTRKGVFCFWRRRSVRKSELTGVRASEQTGRKLDIYARVFCERRSRETRETREPSQKQHPKGCFLLLAQAEREKIRINGGFARESKQGVFSYSIK